MPDKYLCSILVKTTPSESPGTVKLPYNVEVGSDIVAFKNQFRDTGSANPISYAVPFTSVRPPPDLVTCTSNQVGAAFDGVGCAGYQGFVTHVLASNAIHQSNGGHVCCQSPLNVIVTFKTPFVDVSNVALVATPAFPETLELIS